MVGTFISFCTFLNVSFLCIFCFVCVACVQMRGGGDNVNTKYGGVDVLPLENLFKCSFP